jgi:hypothetical protein
MVVELGPLSITKYTDWFYTCFLFLAEQRGFCELPSILFHDLYLEGYCEMNFFKIMNIYSSVNKL